MELVAVEKLTRELMAEHLDTNIWEFGWLSSVRTFGTCTYRMNRNRQCVGGKIQLSKQLCKLNDEATVKLTILHEIAHALTPGSNHDATWVSKCISIGGDGKRCFTSREVETPKLKYFVICEDCGIEHQKTRKPKVQRACVCQKSRNRSEWKTLNYQQRY